MFSKKNIISFASIIITIAGIFSLSYFRQKIYLQDIFKNSYYDYHVHHNQYIDAINWLTEKKLIDSSPKTLIQVDYHSDIYKDNPNIDYGYEGIGNWINVLMTKVSSESGGLISEIYWVLPDNTTNTNEKDLFWDNLDHPHELTLRNGPKDIIAYMDDQTHRIQFTPGNATLRQIPIHKVLLKDLPNFKNSNQQILLSIDYDFFIYNSLDEEGFTAYPNLTNRQINHTLNSFIDVFHQKNIHPIFTGCSVSIGYIQEKWQKNLDSFCNKIKINSKTKTDLITQYTHTLTIPPKEIFPSMKKHAAPQ